MTVDSTATRGTKGSFTFGFTPVSASNRRWIDIAGSDGPDFGIFLIEFVCVARSFLETSFLAPPPTVCHCVHKINAIYFILQCYVQDLLKQNSESVCDALLWNDGHIYVCGDVSMASDVCKMLQNLLQDVAALSQIESQDYISQLRVCILGYSLLQYLHFFVQVYFS